VATSDGATLNKNYEDEYLRDVVKHYRNENERKNTRFSIAQSYDAD